MRCLLVLTGLLFALPAHAVVTIDWVAVGDPGNACDSQYDGCFGCVVNTYRIGKYEVTNAQYAEFLNKVAISDTHGLYNADMGSSSNGGITRNEIGPGSYEYSVKEGMGSKPVNFISFWDALRFANWHHNGQPFGAQDSSTTEDGAYTITADGITNNSIIRNAGAMTFLPSEDEWYKAAYYKGGGTSAGYWEYPTQSDTMPTGEAPPGTDLTNGSANYASVWALTDVGSYTSKPSDSVYGTFDQGGNVGEWNETIIDYIAPPRYRGVRGGSAFHSADIAGGMLSALAYGYEDPTLEWRGAGFRVARIPEAAPIPTLSQWGLIAFGTLLLTATAWALRRRQALDEQREVRPRS